MCSNDRSLDNCSVFEPTDKQKWQDHVQVRGPEDKCADESKPLEQVDGCKPENVVNMSATQDGMVLLDSDSDMVPLNNDEVKDEGWSSELDDMPLSCRIEMLVKDDGWSSELDNMPLSHRREMLLMGKQPAAIIQNNEPLSNISAIHTGNSASELRNAVEIQECIRPSTPVIKSFTVNPGKEPERNHTSSSLISCPFSSTSEVNVKIKAEPTIYDEETLSSKCSAVDDFKFGTIVVKTEENANSDFSDDKIDHMLLRERMKLLTSHFHSDSLMKTSMLDMGPSLGSIKRPLESVKPVHIRRPWKKKKTSTDSVQVALEEDAPGLLRALADCGVTVEEIILYENEEDDELADEDESSGKDSFSELEDIVVQLFSKPESLVKMGHPRSKKDEKATYCLACLFSLVEQTRCLQSRKWPVEWGWSRDFQSFIFIFERHRRIVLERPEYGYATYFFELVDSLPIKWQIKRLVTTMKLGSCGRATLMENKPLVIGEDLSEGEARVLQQFGWTPNSGLGTMLNYCDRVVHDRRNDKDTSDWRNKIGKLLIDGYNAGRTVPVDAAENAQLAETSVGQIKSEPSD